MINLLADNQGVRCDFCTVKVFAVHIHSGNLAVFIGGVVVDSFAGIAAAGIAGVFIFLVANASQTSLFGNAGKNMKELADARGFCIAALGI